MTILPLNPELAYIVLGIDKNENDQVLAVFREYSAAKKFCTEYTLQSEFYDLWIEKHPIE